MFRRTFLVPIISHIKYISSIKRNTSNKDRITFYRQNFILKIVGLQLLKEKRKEILAPIDVISSVFFFRKTQR